jgi:hypothetical protein
MDQLADSTGHPVSRPLGFGAWTGEQLPVVRTLRP